MIIIKTIIFLSIFINYIGAQGPDLNALIEDIWGTGRNPKNDESSESNETPQTPSTPVTVTSRTSELDTTTQNCECVPYYLCRNGTVNTNGEDIIDIRLGQCPHYLQICCGAESISETTPTPLPPAPKPVGCGYRNPDGVGFRIKGQMDSEAEFGEFPWMVAIFSAENKKMVYYCGGALIHPEVVLTAAHCVKNKKNVLKIRAGEWDTQTEQELLSYQDREIASVIIHPQYYAGALYNDVALLFLKKPVQLDQHINVICLPPEGTVVDSSRCFSSGWGKDKFGQEGSYQSILKKVELPMVPRKKCQEYLRKTRLGNRFELHKSFVCAGAEEGLDTCKGDGGSPLVCPIPGQKDRYYQIGMVAWGIGCGGRNIPGVYVNVALFREWIDQELKRNSHDISSYQY